MGIEFPLPRWESRDRSSGSRMKLMNREMKVRVNRRSRLWCRVIFTVDGVRHTFGVWSEIR